MTPVPWTEAVMSEQDHRILCAVFLAAYDNHAPIDMMVGKDWDRMLQIVKVLDEEIYDAVIADAEG